MMDIFPALIFFISFFGLITSKNVIRTIIFVLMMQTSVVMFWLTVGAREGILPPIQAYENLDNISDPLPQALMITAIVIGISVVAIAITMFNTLFRKYKTSDWKELKDKVHADGEKL